MMMASDFRKQYRQLVRDVLKFIDHPGPQAQRTTSPREAPALTKPQSQSYVQTMPEPSPSDGMELPAAPQESVDLPVSVKKKPVVEKKSRWELQTLTTVDHQSAFYKKLAPFVPVCEPQIPIWLMLPEENPTHRLFLENVSRAITRTYAAASVLSYSEKLLNSAQGKIVLIPIECLKKKYPDCQPHKVFNAGFFTAIPMETLDSYMDEVQSKRALWTAIQNLFQS